jgi:hypothetical protein
MSLLLELRFPGNLDDVAVRVEALDAHVPRLLPLLRDRDAICLEPVAEGSDLLGPGDVAPKWRNLGSRIGSSVGPRASEKPPAL